MGKGAFWVAAAFACLGLAVAGAAIVLVLLHGGSTGFMIARLGFILPIAVVCAMTASTVLGVGRVASNPTLFLGMTVATVALGNLAVPFLALGKGAWGAMLLLRHPPGLDFRQGLYDPAAAFSTVKSAWPPLTLVLGRPFTLLSYSSGYIVQVVVLVGLGVAAAAFSASLATRAAESSGLETGNRSANARRMFLMLAFWLVSSYGFLFEVERGNLDLYAIFFSVLCVWLLLRSPRFMWLSVVSLAVASNLKIYPAILLVLVFWRYRWRALLPVVVSNSVLLMIAGPSNLWHFLVNNSSMLGNPNLWPGNHSAAGFAHVLRQTFGWLPSSLQYVFVAGPVVLWAATAVILIGRGWSQRGAVLLAAASVPLMSIVPSVSHDYKLVLLVFPLAVLASLLAVPATTARDSPVLRSALLGLLAVDMVLLSTPTLLWGTAGLGNKYPLLVLMQLLCLAVVLGTAPRRSRNADSRADERTCPGVEGGGLSQ
jgi:hypothetical protein